jgi:Predicted flavoprotein involved in K+ transport
MAREHLPGDLHGEFRGLGRGPLTEPALPDIDGLDEFEGEIFHSARWNHDFDLTGKRVAVIGTGASAIQIVPELAKTVRQLDVYQRTAPWVLPRFDRDYTTAERLPSPQFPATSGWIRSAMYWSKELSVSP